MREGLVPSWRMIGSACATGTPRRSLLFTRGTLLRVAVSSCCSFVYAPTPFPAEPVFTATVLGMGSLGCVSEANGRSGGP